MKTYYFSTMLFLLLSILAVSPPVFSQADAPLCHPLENSGQVDKANPLSFFHQVSVAYRLCLFVNCLCA
jgi:hypothetical protein